MYGPERLTIQSGASGAYVPEIMSVFGCPREIVLLANPEHRPKYSKQDWQSWAHEQTPNPEQPNADQQQTPKQQQQTPNPEQPNPEQPKDKQNKILETANDMARTADVRYKYMEASAAAAAATAPYPARTWEPGAPLHEWSSSGHE